MRGAEKYLSAVDEVLLKNSEVVVKRPSTESRIIHRIAIAFGSPEFFPLPIGVLKLFGLWLSPQPE